MRPNHPARAMTIIEVLIAAMILFVAALGLMMVVTFSARSDMVNSEQMTAMAAANQKLEELRDTDWDTLFATYNGSPAAGGVRYPTATTDFLPGLELQQGELRIFVFYNENDTSDPADLAGVSEMRGNDILRNPRVAYLPPGTVTGDPAATSVMVAGSGAGMTDFNDDGDWIDTVAGGTIGPPEFIPSPYAPNPGYPKFIPVMVTCTWVGVLNNPSNANDRSQIVVRARIGRRRY